MKNWITPKTKEEAKAWRSIFKNAISSEDEQVPQWCQALSLNLPDYAYLKIPQASQFGIHVVEDLDRIKTNKVLTRLNGIKPSGYIKFETIYDKHANDITLKLHDVYILPEFRKQGLTSELVDLIEHEIKESMSTYNSTPPVIVESLIASLSGLSFYNKLKSHLHETGLDIDFNTTGDPSYTI